MPSWWRGRGRSAPSSGSGARARAAPGPGWRAGGARGFHVLAGERPNRQTRRRRGTSDPLAAEAAARAVRAGPATGRPKAGAGPGEMVRALQVARRAAVRARPQAANQRHALVVTAPDGLRARRRGLPRPQLAARAAGFRCAAPPTTALAATTRALRSIAVRYQGLCAALSH